MCLEITNKNLFLISDNWNYGFKEFKIEDNKLKASFLNYNYKLRKSFRNELFIKAKSNKQIIDFFFKTFDISANQFCYGYISKETKASMHIAPFRECEKVVFKINHNSFRIPVKFKTKDIVMLGTNNITTNKLYFLTIDEMKSLIETLEKVKKHLDIELEFIINDNKVGLSDWLEKYKEFYNFISQLAQ